MRPAMPGESENRRIILWKTEFEPGRVFGCGYSEQEFRAIPSHLASEAADIKAIVQDAIRNLPPEEPALEQ